MPEFKTVGGPRKYFKYNECEKGQLLVEGKYVGRSPNKFGKENFDFKPDNGPMVSLNHAGHLNYLIETYVREGDLVQVVYDGKSKLDKGTWKGKEVHQFQVNVAQTEEQWTGTAQANESEELDLSDLD
jgi:hypothetical protein